MCNTGTASISLIKLISGPGLSCNIVQCAWSVALIHGHKNFLVLFCEVKLGFTNLDKTNTYLKSDKIQDTHQPVKNRTRPKRRHIFIAVRYNERNNRNAPCFFFFFFKVICKKTTAVMTPDFFFDFSFYYPVRNFILKYEYSLSAIYKSYTSFSVGRWLRFFYILAYRVTFN